MFFPVLTSGALDSNIEYLIHMGVKKSDAYKIQDHLGPHYGIRIYSSCHRQISDATQEDPMVLPLTRDDDDRHTIKRPKF